MTRQVRRGIGSGLEHRVPRLSDGEGAVILRVCSPCCGNRNRSGAPSRSPSEPRRCRSWKKSPAERQRRGSDGERDRRRIDCGCHRTANLPSDERLLLRLKGEVPDAPTRNRYRAGLDGSAGRRERRDRGPGRRGATIACVESGAAVEHDVLRLAGRLPNARASLPARCARLDLHDRKGSGALEKRLALSGGRRQHDRESWVGQDGEQRRVRLRERDLHGPPVGRADLLHDARYTAKQSGSGG